jgi:hypothetical protein
VALPSSAIFAHVGGRPHATLARACTHSLPTLPPAPTPPQVEELIRTKPAAKPLLAAPAASLLDFSLPSLGLSGSSSPATGGPASGRASPAPGGGEPGAGAASKFDAFTKKFKATVVDLMNTDLAAPYEPGARAQAGSLAHQTRAGSPAGLPLPPRSATPGTPLPGGASAGGGSRAATPQPGAGAGAAQAAAGAAGGGSAAGSPSPLPPASQAPTSPGPRDTAASPAPVQRAAPQPQPQSQLPASLQPQQAASGAVGGWGLRERLVAVESLSGIAEELKAAKAALIGVLTEGGAQPVATSAAAAPEGAKPQAARVAAAQGQQQAAPHPGGLGREVELYFARTVDAVADLRGAIFRGATRQLLQVGFRDGGQGWRRWAGAGAAAATLCECR